MLDRRDFLASVSLMALASPVSAQGAAPLAFGTTQRTVSGRTFEALNLSEPVLRGKRQVELTRKLDNKLPQSADLIGIGMRVDGGRGGIRGLSTGAVAAQGSVDLAFSPRDPGTFLLRPSHSQEGQRQLAAGLAGLIVVEEPTPLLVDRDVPLLLQDWTQHLATLPPLPVKAEEKKAEEKKDEETKEQDKQAQSTTPAPPLPLTANGEHGHEIKVRMGERLRLRIANASPCSIIEVTITDHDAYLIAFDGYPSDLFRLERSSMVLAPGQRADVLVDCLKGQSTAAAIVAANGHGQTEVAKIVYDKTEVWRKSAVPLPPPLPLSDLPYEMNFDRAWRAHIICAKGPGGYVLDVKGKPPVTPFLKLGKLHIAMLAFENKTDTYHSVTVQGHPFRLLDGRDDGWKPYWLNSVLVAPNSITRVAFRADVAGRWPINWTIIGDVNAGPTAYYDVS